jgi:hypothetical protein
VCPHQPDSLLSDLLWVLACSCHCSILSKVGASSRPGEVQTIIVGSYFPSTKQRTIDTPLEANEYVEKRLKDVFGDV